MREKTKEKNAEEKVRFIVNGVPIERLVHDDRTLLRFLRDDLKLTGTKEGCSQGHCGTCTVIVDGKPVRSCAQKISRLNGKNINTIEGLSAAGSLHPLQQAFLAAGAVQCGFCTPGMIMAAKALLDKNPSPSEDEIKKGLKHNLCRCTGYVKIVDAVRMASRTIARQSGRALEPFVIPADFAFMGVSLPDVDGISKVKGELTFADDIHAEDMGHGKILWSQYPHAEILSVDVSKAEKVDGVRVVLIGKDIPGRNEFGILKLDQPVLVEKKVRFLGDPVAFVVADSQDAANEAAKQISVEYRQLRGVFSPQEALLPDAPALYESGNVMRRIDHNVGDIEQAFKAADLIIEKEYSTPFIDHAFLEPESAVAALFKDESVEIWTCTQMPFELRTQVATCLGLPEEKVRIIATPLGGGFGGKISVTVQALAALGALRTRRPVKVTLTREESLRFHTKKHASVAHYRTGFTKEGKIIANHAKIMIDTGPYTDVAPIVIDQAAIFSCGPYEIPSARIEGLAVYTNNANGGAMRGFGINQVAFAMEQQLDIAAEKLKIDPFELRLMNALEIGKRTVTGETLRASVPIKETIRAARKAFQSLGLLVGTTASDKKLGVGIASGFKNVGAGKGSVDNGGAIVELTREGKLRIYVSSVDMGQGNRTAMVQLAAHECGISSDNIEIVTGDTGLVLKAVGVVGERATYCSGNAVILGVRAFKEALLDKASRELNMPRSELDMADNVIVPRHGASVLTLEALHGILDSKGERLRVEYCYVAPRTFPISYSGIPDGGNVLDRYEPATDETRDEYRNYPAYAYITNVAIVEVDEGTGDVKVRKVITAVDVGKAINPQKIEGQIEGSIVMGMGYALSEQYELLQGVPKTTDLKKCGILGIDQTPDMTTLIIEDEDPGGPYGAKGISEVATVPITPAVINAIHNAVGVRIYDLPATKDRLLEALKSRD